MGKTLRKFSNKEKKTQQRRKTKGRKQHKNRKTYGGGDDCKVGTGNISDVDANTCTINNQSFKEEHKAQIIKCFNAQAEKAGELKNLNEEQTNKLKINENSNESTIKTNYRKLSVKLHPDKGGDEDAFKKLVSSYNFLQSECEPEPEEEVDIVNQNQRLKIINKIMKNIFGNECDKKHPEPTGFFGAKLKPDDPKIQTRNNNLAKCESNNRKKVIDYLANRKELGLPELPTESDINKITLEIVEKTQFDVLNKRCLKHKQGSYKQEEKEKYENACEELENNVNPLTGGSKKSNRKTKKVKYSKKK